jgi:hypothetical protein
MTMKNVLLVAVAATMFALPTLAQEQLLTVPLREPQRIYVCTTPEPILDVLTGLMQPPEKMVDRRSNYMLGKPDGTKDCDYLKDANGDLLAFSSLDNFVEVREETMTFGAEVVNFSLNKSKTPNGEIFFILMLSKPNQEGLYTDVIEPIGKMPDKP